MKRCIFHYPAPISDNPKVGSQLRPHMMLRAFKNIGYEVAEVTGYGEERKEKIKKIKESIKAGDEYDFLYAESLTLPTLLSEKNHMPRYPFLDFSFFDFCKKNKIRISLFYRDMYWKFPIYKESVPFRKRIITKPLYIYDIYKYIKLIDIIYVPSNKIQKYMPKNVRLHELPPGGDASIQKKEDRIKHIYKERKVNIFYVGGITGLNDISGLCKAVMKNRNINLVVCTTKTELSNEKNIKEFQGCERIRFIQGSTKDLGKYYKEADVAALYFENNSYRDMAMPIKLFEYISYGIPVISNSNTAAAKFIEDKDIGWVIDYNPDEICKLLDKLVIEKEEIRKKSNNMLSIINDNTWESRARQVAREISEKA